MSRGAVRLATPAAIARALRRDRSRLAEVDRQIRDAERLAGELLQWRSLTLARGAAAVGGFRRA